MKLIIDIPEEKLNIIKNKMYCGIYDADVYKAIVNGTPIPGNATNGDVIISLYPNLKYTIQNNRVVTTIGVASSFDADWWNTPYQKGGKDEQM